MSISDRNRKCALSRWARVRLAERQVICFNPELMARLCGFLAGDGSVQIRQEPNGKLHHSVEFFPDDESLIDPFCESMLFIYGKRPTIWKSANHFRLRLCSKTIVKHLLSLSKFGLTTWTIPKKVLTTQRAKKEWLRAFFDSEAYVGKRCIRVQSVNRIGILAVSDMLYELGIASKYYEYQPRNERWSKTYILTINKKSDRLKFLKRIGFNHRRKLTRLLSYLDNAEVA